MPAGKLVLVAKSKKERIYKKVPKFKNKFYKYSPQSVLHEATKGAEWKNLDTQSNNTTPDDITGVMLSPLGQLKTGVDSTTRVGKKIVVRTFQCKGTITAAADAIAARGYTYVRVLVAVDKQANASTALLSDIIKEDHVSSLNVSQPMNLENSERFTVIYDKLVRLDVATGVSKQFKFYKKLNMPVEFNTAPASISGTIPITNNIVVGYVSNEHNELPTVIYQNRIRFTDN